MVLCTRPCCKMPLMCKICTTACAVHAFRCVHDAELCSESPPVSRWCSFLTGRKLHLGRVLLLAMCCIETHSWEQFCSLAKAEPYGILLAFISSSASWHITSQTSICDAVANACCVEVQLPRKPLHAELSIYLVGYVNGKRHSGLA